jgi:DNA-binding MarR family transcriptional regulator
MKSSKTKNKSLPHDPAFGFERPEDSPGFLLWQTTISWQRLIKKQLDHYDISHPQFVIMAILLWFGEAKQILIIEQSKLDKMTVSKSLKKLASQGLIKRAEHKTDSRAKIVNLTKKGKNLVQKLVPIVEKIDEEFFGKPSKKEQQMLIDILVKLAS